MNILVYSHNLSPRLRYIFKQIFNNVLNVNVSFTDNIEYFINNDLPKISYTHRKISNELFFRSTDLLFEKTIVNQDIKVLEFRSIKFFYPCEDSCLPFDPFAASFFMLSRYEEYLPHIKDKFGRFEAKESFAYKNNFLDKPIVDIWAVLVKEELVKYYPNLIFPIKNYNYLNTIDIDNAFSYLDKGFLRNIGGFFRDLIKNNRPFERIKVLFKYSKDPYDTYSKLFDFINKYNLKTIFFFLLADYGYNDKNVPYTSNRLRELIKQISDYCNIGIHASYNSLKNTNKLKIEMNRLSEILHKEVLDSRQHFIKLNMPSMYRNLIKNGIKDDYSMGFVSLPGFRAGTCSKFSFYDLDLESETDLNIHPFSIMDVTLNDYMNLTPSQSIDIIRNIIDEIKIVEGTFISIWHNESLNYSGRWYGWDNVYLKMIKYAKKHESF